MGISNWGQRNSAENISMPKALPPEESPYSYAYSFQPTLTNAFVEATGIGNILHQIVPFGGGLQKHNEMVINPDGKHVSQLGKSVVLSVTKRTPLSVVQKVFNELNATGKVVINLGGEHFLES